jgi:hypothetical protein
MRATANGEPLLVAAITLDDFGWDSRSSRGPVSVVLRLDEPELLAVGAALHGYAQECLAEDPAFFEGEFRQDIPVPTSARLFVDQPGLLGTYLEDPFWKREAVLAILDAGGSTGAGTHLIQDFRRVQAEDDTVAVEFGATVTGR